MSAEAPKKRSLKFKILAGVAVLFVAAQLVPYGRNHTNPPVVQEPQWKDPATREIFFRACKDCHSNESSWPWYSNIAPVSWLVQRDVDEGRAEFNISEWSRPENEGDEAAKEVRNGSMPPKAYLLTHPEAKLSEAEKQQFIQGLVATFGDKAS